MISRAFSKKSGNNKDLISAGVVLGVSSFGSICAEEDEAEEAVEGGTCVSAAVVATGFSAGGRLGAEMEGGGAIG